MASVREQLLQHFALEGAAREGADELADALYVLLYSAHLNELSVDGWDFFRVMRESEDSLDAVGLMALLPSDYVPIQISVRGHARGFTWSAAFGRLDPAWLAMSDSKRWKSLYLYATGAHEKPVWTWNQHHHGSVDRADG